MVGIILLKDFITGSYRYPKMALFSGMSYSDIKPEKSFSEYVVDIETKKIVSKKLSLQKIDDVSYFELMNLCNEYMNFLVSNPYAVCVEFKANNNKTEFRIVPTSHGDFVLPDLYNFLHSNALYFPLETYTFKTGNGSLRSNPLEADISCELINYAVHTLVNGMPNIFYQAGGTLYLDICPVINNKFLRTPLKKYFSAYPDVYKTACKIYKQRQKKTAHELPTMPFSVKTKKPLYVIEAAADGNYAKLINSLRKAKLATFNVAVNQISNSNGERLVKNLFEFAYNKELVEIKNTLYKEIINYAEKLVEHKYLPDRNSINYFTVTDILTAEFSAVRRASLSSEANLLKHTAVNFEKRKNYIIAYDGTAFEFKSN